MVSVIKAVSISSEGTAVVTETDEETGAGMTGTDEETSTGIKQLQLDDAVDCEAAPKDGGNGKDQTASSRCSWFGDTLHSIQTSMTKGEELENFEQLTTTA